MSNIFYFYISYIYTIILLYTIYFFIDKKYNKIKLFYAISAMFISILEAISISTIMSDIDSLFLLNIFDIDNYIACIKDFNTYLKLITRTVGILVILLYFTEKIVKNIINISNKKIKKILIIINIILLIIPFSFLNRISVNLLDIHYTLKSNKSFEDSFITLRNKNYVPKKNLKVKLPNITKNLVIIALESFENSFFNEKYFDKNLTKNLKILADSNEYYYNIPQLYGANNTFSAMHTILCGTPKVFKNKDNENYNMILNFQNNNDKLVCLMDILKKANYNQLYLGGCRKTYTSKDNFYKSHGLKEENIYGETELMKEYPNIKNKSVWGIYDIDLIEIAKEKYKNLSKKNKPFNMIIMLSGTHPPKGLKDSRCKINKYNKDMLNNLECTDLLVNNFINFLKQQKNYKNTLILIIPDHLQFQVSELNNKLIKIKNRSLFAIFLNSNSNKKYSNEILYSDISPLILKKLNIKHNAVFLLENYGNQTNKERIEFINKNYRDILNFNNKNISNK